MSTNLFGEALKLLHCHIYSYDNGLIEIKEVLNMLRIQMAQNGKPQLEFMI